MKNGIVSVYKTAVRTNEYLAEKKPLAFKAGNETLEEEVINIYDDVKYQEILGFGGAFTESAAYNYHLMGSDTKKHFIDAYFDDEIGIGYSIGRTHIASCDFSLEEYSNVSDDDKSLSTFSIERDREYIIPLVSDAIKKTGGKIVLFASPWSPPAFMKTNGFAVLGGMLKEEYMDSWADYFVKYIKAYKAEGVDIWGVTVQNEPNAIQTWESCQFSAQQEADFIKNHLAPALDKAKLSDIQIITWDHNKEQLYDRARITYADEAVRKRVWGSGIHWYSGEHFEALRITKERFPEKNLLVTEFCAGVCTKDKELDVAQKYAHDMIGNLLGGVCGICDWNIVLDLDGGPYHNRFCGCGAPIMYDIKNDELDIKPAYYYMGHFSKFIKRGAKRLAMSKYSEKIEVCAFENTDGTIAAVILNCSPKKVAFNLKYNGLCAHGVSSPHSIMTLVFDKNRICGGNNR